MDSVSPDLHIDPDAVDELARLARRIAADLDEGAPVGCAGAADVAETLTASARRATAELVAFAGAAQAAARRIREAERVAAERLRDPRR